MSVPLLLAAGDDGTMALIKVAVILLFILIPMVGQFLAKLKGVGPGRPNGRPARPQNQGANMQDQIEEFLRRASQRRAGDTPQQPSQPQPAPPVAAEVVGDEPVGDRVRQQVGQYLDPTEFRRLSDQVGKDIGQGDDRFEQSVQQAFSGDVSQLSKKPGESANAPEPSQVMETDEALPAAPAFAEGLVGFLSNPDNLVQSLIVHEILTSRVEE